MNRFAVFGIGVVLGLAIILSAWLVVDGNYTYHGVLIDPPAHAAEINLVDQRGNPFSLAQQRGKAVLIFFGYTNCPDICPSTLALFKQIQQKLGPVAPQVAFVFLTIDPERDTPARVKQYLAGFDPSFIGLSGDLSALEQVWKSYGVFREKKEVGSAAGYLMDHSTRIYLIDPQGNWRLNYPFGMAAEEIAADLKHLLNENN